MKTRHALGLLTLTWVLLACETKIVTESACGDGYLDPGEECEQGDLQGQTCASLGHYIPEGALGCGPTCRFDRTACGGRCGDLLVDAEREDCDGGLAPGQTCEGLGYSGGTLACGGGCRLDVSGCVSECGNGLAEPDEACDDGNSEPGDGCSPLCGIEPGWSCAPDGDLSVCVSICGDGVAVGAETCDGADLRGRDCRDAGFQRGQLACDGVCALDVSGCAGFCGDGEVSPADGESCDGDDLNHLTCRQLGFYRGTLHCAAGCVFDVSGCEGWCGDGIEEPGNGEHCDPAAPVTSACSDHGFYEGSPACGADCTWDLSGCTGSCGDGTIQEGLEDCDGALLGVADCRALGFYRGQPACDVSCVHDTALCDGRCGDGVAESGEGELCDWDDTLGVACNDLDLPGGTLRCAPGCGVYDKAGCHRWVQVDAGGGNFNCAVRSDGSLWCWGRGDSGQLGEGLTQHRSSPVPVVGMTGQVASVALGESHACAVKTDGSLWCWGYNQRGQLGDASLISRSTPVAVIGMAGGVQSVSMYAGHSCAVKTDGSLWCWGANDQGQLGDGTVVDKTTPICPNGMHTQVRAVAVGHFHTCALRADGTVWCWGRGTEGQLGNGAAASSTVPVQVTGLTGLTPAAILSGSYFNYVILDTGLTRAWGYNSIGMLADGTIVNRPAPVSQIGLDDGVAAFDGSRHFACAAAPSGQLSCWGTNGDGVFGNGTTGYSYTAVPIPGETAVVGIATGYSHTCVLRPDGTIGCTGFNMHGQLGDGTLIDRTTFANVRLP